MPASKARLGAGDVEIKLDGESVVLKPTLRAAQAISRQQGGIAAAIDAVGRMNLDAIASIITLGANESDAKTVAEHVYSTGVISLAAPVIRFLHVLGNGGRPPEEARQEAEENPQSE